MRLQSNWGYLLPPSGPVLLILNGEADGGGGLGHY